MIVAVYQRQANHCIIPGGKHYIVILPTLIGTGRCKGEAYPTTIMTIGKQRRVVDLLIILGLLLLVAGIVAFIMEGYVVALICLPAAILLFVAVDWGNE